MKKFPISKSRAIELECWIIENYEIITSSDLETLLKEKFSPDEYDYLLEAFRMPYGEIKEELTNYDDSKQQNILKFINELCQKYKVDTKTILKRIAYTRSITDYVKKYPETTMYNLSTTNNLVRDNIPELLISSGQVPIYTTLSDTEFWQYLLKKDTEETAKLKDVSTPEELEDILAEKLELLRTMSEYHDIDLGTIACKAYEINETKGKYKNKIFLKSTYRK